MLNSSKSRVVVGVVSVATLAALGAVLACSGGEPSVGDADVERAKSALQPFKKQLKAALLEGLEDGPEAAIAVCKDRATAIAEGLRNNGVEVGRTSYKLRNPDNAPADWMEPLLAYYVDGGDDSHRSVILEDGRFGYVEPIVVQKSCLMCHGRDIAPALGGRITKEYPEDRATGFAEGDLRGLFWVTMPLATEGE
jgi:hypothetical protein